MMFATKRDMPECDPHNMDREELEFWASMGDEGCRVLLENIIAEEEENEIYSRDALLGAI